MVDEDDLPVAMSASPLLEELCASRDKLRAEPPADDDAQALPVATSRSSRNDIGATCRYNDHALLS